MTDMTGDPEHLRKLKAQQARERREAFENEIDKSPLETFMGSGSSTDGAKKNVVTPTPRPNMRRSSTDWTKKNTAAPSNPDQRITGLGLLVFLANVLAILMIVGIIVGFFIVIYAANAVN